MLLVVCKDRSNRCVLVTRRNETTTTAIALDSSQNMRVVRRYSNRDFDKRFKITLTSPFGAIVTWTKSTIKMAGSAREEFRMISAIFRNKVTAKAETMDEMPEGLNEKTVFIEGADDLEGKSMKELVKLYNCTLEKDDRVKAIPGVEGDINAAIQAVVAALDEYVVPEKPVKTSTRKVAKSYSFVGMPKEGEKLPPQAVEILKILEESGGPVERTDLLGAMEGRVETRQSQAAILAFYQKRLVENGFITIQ